ncbi:hypothetical protein BKP45_05075 [Anaerobacillus alkalidiazotrophicus]|uniref:Uncharacterized protein n=1 Tax=Anaerobacillus alkalidiazotrophicus TaxID=472963 RepID=A0A1S2MBH5_9BACI|nr:hypothetical protein [Anaerobacillus alkalidiazotrophicus]OIJ22051.1 hypothetical protein BKP45_05075 [Anaerobacillus alkalidiazotrophicus]
MLRNDTVKVSLSGKKVFSVLCIFLVIVMFFSQVARAASWTHYDSDLDAVIFDYTDTVDFLVSNNFYMEVSFVKDNNYTENGVVVRTYNDLSGHYYATANGLYTIKFFRPDDTQYLSNYQTVVTQIQDETWEGGSDGSGSIGYDGNDGDTGNDPDDDGDLPGSGDDGGEGIDFNDFFNAPGWQDYMGKIDEIKNAIPPPPNWEQVADTFYDRVVPKLVNDLESMLGTAPPPPSSPAIIEPINPPTPSKPAILDYAHNLEQKTPQMQQNTELENATFSLDDIKTQAPVIEVREDESGGFDLSTSDPVNSLPDLPFDGFPVPGMESAGEWDYQPEMPTNNFPMPNESSGVGGTIDPGEPPLPSNSGSEAPIPGDSSNDAPTPGQEYNPPMPGGGFEINYGDYKTHPDNPDGQ